MIQAPRWQKCDEWLDRGGWIVAAEPDWAGIRVDHVDRAAMDLIHARAMRNRQPDMGTLYRRIGEQGLTERRAAAVVGEFADFEILKGYGLDLPAAAASLVADGAITQARADAVLSSLEAANAAGQSYSVATIHVVGGRAPS
jgi:hypothetical protein